LKSWLDIADNFEEGYSIHIYFEVEHRIVYRYQDRVSEAVIGAWSEWSDEPAIVSTNREVREQILYRHRAAIKVVYHYFRWGAWSAWTDGTPDDRYNTDDYETQTQTAYRYRTNR